MTTTTNNYNNDDGGDQYDDDDQQRQQRERTNTWDPTPRHALILVDKQPFHRGAAPIARSAFAKPVSKPCLKFVVKGHKGGKRRK